MGLGANLRGGGGRFKDVGMEEGARRRIVELGHRVRLVGGEVVVCSRVIMVVTRLIRTESARRRHAAEMRVVLERICRQQTAPAPATAAADVTQLLVFHVTSGFVHGGTVSGRRSGSGNRAAALVGAGTSADGQRRGTGGRAPAPGVGDRLIVVVGAGKIDGGRGRREGGQGSLDPGAAGRDPGARERSRIEVDSGRRRPSSGARMTDEKITITIDNVQF